jgi:hypothetical protein
MVSLRSDPVSGGDFHRRTLLNAGDGDLLHALPVGRLRCELKGELTRTSAITAIGYSGVNEAPFFGYFGEELGQWVQDHLEQRQLLIMGGATYDALARFAQSATDKVNARMTDLPKLVF